ncbi:MAG: ABC transporter ATP-binding protein [Firmicutes bacterium]|nr:ABC transporter ATP-binding protein [Bacillota bacterium]
MTEPKLVVRDLAKYFPVGGTLLDRVLGRQPLVRAVDGVDFTIRAGEVFGLVGESGSGKTTVGRLSVGLLAPSRGEVLYEGQPVTTRMERRLRRRLQIIFQDPLASLNPAMTIYEGIEHALLIHEPGLDRAGRRARVYAVMEKVGLAPPETLAGAYPADLSGGQRQRAVIARAMVLGPDFVVADEPVSMLDMSIRARVLRLLLDLKQEMGLTYLFITHDLATARFVCDRVGVMYLGQLVEVGPVDEVFERPLHPYTKALMRAVPVPDPRLVRPQELPRGEIPDAVRPPAGCRFHPRCPEALPECGWEPRDLADLFERHSLELEGALDLREVPEADTLVVPDSPAFRKLLDAERAARTPLGLAVEEVRPVGGAVEVRFRDPAPVPESEVGGRRVRCLRAAV